MRRIIACAVLVVAVAGALQFPGIPTPGLIAGFGLLGLLAWRLSVCPHSGPLALLPPTTDFDGTPLPARWHCDSCGRTWVANFEKEHTPIRKFTGYDESKAVQSAKRAADLADRQRVLAAQRAGVRPAASRRVKPPVQPAHDIETADVVSIRHGRRLAG